MSHTMQLIDGWIAITDGSPSDDSEVIFKKTGEKKELKLPYTVVQQFVANTIRNEKIEWLEQASNEEIFRL